jgi:hypothetical protein
MNRVEMIPQFFLTEVLRWTRMVSTLNALPTAIINLPIDVVLNVLGIMGRIFHLHETTLRHTVRTPTRRCKNSFGGDRAINDVWTFSMPCAMSVPLQITQEPGSTLDAKSGPCWYRYLGVHTVFASNMCVQVSQRASVEGAVTPLAVDSIGCDVTAHVRCRRFRIVKADRTAGRPHAFRLLPSQSCGELMLHFMVLVLLRALKQVRFYRNPKTDEPDLAAYGKEAYRFSRMLHHGQHPDVSGEAST